MIRGYLGFLVLRGAIRLAWRLFRVVVLVGLMVLAAPATLVAGYAAGLAWLLGWPPARLYRAAGWCLPMLAAWLAAAAANGVPWWPRVAAQPYLAWLAMWHDLAAGAYPLAAVTIAPAAIPLGLAAGGLAWSWRSYALETGSGGLAPSASAAFDARQWRHQVRSAQARIAAPGSVPLLTRGGGVAAGATIRAVRHRARPVAVLPYPRLRSHQVVIGTTGTGKTTLLLRLWAGFTRRGLQLHAAGGHRPLLVVIDCKGGADSRRIAERARRVLRAAGAAATAIWPDEASLSLWDLPPGRLTSTLADMIEHGSGGAAYYADVLEEVVALAVGAPCGPPRSAVDFLARLDAGWLRMAYAAAPDTGELALLGSAGRHIADVALRYRSLLRRLGGGLDGPGTFGDADAWYCILEGTAEIAVAEAQARALVDLLAWYAADPVAGARREILLAVDEFSAVSRRLPIWQLYERARSLGLAVQVSAQSWHGLAADEDERYRVAGTADGGIWLLRTPHPEPVAALAGSRRGVDTARRLLGAALWAHEGLSRAAPVPVVDPDLIRGLAVGQAAYIYRGGVTYVQVKRLVAGPPELAAAAEPSAAAAVAGHAIPGRGIVAAQPATPPPDAGELLDEAFGPER